MKKLVSLVLVGLVLAACSSVMLTGRKQLLLVNDSEVLASSFQSYKQFIDSVPPSKDKVNSALVDKVRAKIAAAVETYMKANGQEADIANYAWESHLLRDSSANAFCMPGGKIVVFDGIIPITLNESGLAVVMGHEIAHAVAKHSNERMSHQMIAQYGSSITDVLTSNKSATTRAVIGTVYGVGTQYGVMLPYSRKHELEADRLGLIFLAMAGYDPTQAIAFWERMAANSKGAPMEIMSTHPSDATRIAQMKACLPEAMKYYKK